MLPDSLSAATDLDLPASLTPARDSYERISPRTPSPVESPDYQAGETSYVYESADDGSPVQSRDRKIQRSAHLKSTNGNA